MFQFGLQFVDHHWVQSNSNIRVESDNWIFRDFDSLQYTRNNMYKYCRHMMNACRYLRDRVREYRQLNIQMFLSMFIIITIARRHRNIQTHLVVCCSSFKMLLNLWNFALILSFERCLSRSFAKDESSKFISETYFRFRTQDRIKLNSLALNSLM